MISNVKWYGLTEMIMDLKNMPARMRREVNQYTKDVLEMTHQIYVENLSGSAPSTAGSPLPVGMRSRDLRNGAMKRQINQYACEVYNDVPYAGFIEVGTKKMVARRPLGDAIDQMDRIVPGRMGQVLTTVIIGAKKG